MPSAFFFGPDSYEWRIGHGSPCCGEGKNCFNYDSQYLWVEDTIQCVVGGRKMAFESIPSDIVIQEQYDDFCRLTNVQNFLKQWNKNDRIAIPHRIKVIAPTTKQNPPVHRDGLIQFDETLNIYNTYRSMVKTDVFCKKRVKNRPNCRNLVGGVLQKLSFFDQVHFDPAQNNPKFPQNPIALYGSNGKPTDPPNDGMRQPARWCSG